MSWSLKKWVFSSGRWTKKNIDLVTSRCLLSRNNTELSESVSFAQKLRYFTDQNELNEGPHENEF